MFTGMRCDWCHVCVHSSCIRQVDQECDLGVLRNIYLPREALLLPITNLSMEEILNCTNRRKAPSDRLQLGTQPPSFYIQHSNMLVRCLAPVSEVRGSIPAETQNIFVELFGTRSSSNYTQLQCIPDVRNPLTVNNRLNLLTESVKPIFAMNLNAYLTNYITKFCAMGFTFMAISLKVLKTQSSRWVMMINVKSGATRLAYEIVS